MKISLSLAGLIWITITTSWGQMVYSQQPQPPFPYKSIDVRYTNSTDTSVHLAATLTLPNGTGSFPAVLLISGSGQSQRDMPFYGHKMFLVIADYLTRRGLAVLRFDDRGAGESTVGSKPISQLTDVEFDGDVRAGIDFLRSRPEINPRLIGLAGHSQGTGTALHMATQTPNDIAFLVLLASAAPTMTAGEIVAEQMMVKAKLKGYSEQAQAATSHFINRSLIVVKAEGNQQKRNDALKAIADDELTKVPLHEREIWNNEIRIRVGDLTNDFFHQDANKPHPDLLRQIKVPVLALNGEKDVLIPASKTVAQLKASLQNGNNGDYAVHLLPGLNHMFQVTQTGLMEEGKDVSETFSISTLQLISDWLIKHVRQ